jgi:hypothetical protein
VCGQRATQSSEQLLVCGVVVIVGLGLVVMWMLFVQPTALRKGYRLPVCAASIGNSHFGKLRRAPSFSEGACLMSLAFAGWQATANRVAGCAAGVLLCEWPCRAVMHRCAGSMGC